MKKVIFLLFGLVIFSSCSQPVRVTANPDNTSATSGTLGSVKASDGVVPLPMDSLPVKDTLRQ